MTRLLLAATLLSGVLFAESPRAHLKSATLDVYVAAVDELPGIPGVPDVHGAVVSVRSTDDLSIAVWLRVMLRLDDGTRIARTAVLENNAGGMMTLRVPTGPRTVVEIVDVKAANLHKDFSDVPLSAAVN